MLLSFIFAVFAATCTSAIGVPKAEASQRPMATIYRSCKNKNDVALTFDDGPYIFMEDISDTLVAHGAVGTFFLNGNNWACIYNADEMKRVKYAYNHGHQIASHTWAHLNLTALTWDRIHDEMYRVELALSRIIGVKPAFVRPPYGLYNDLVRQAAYVRNQSLVIWDFDSGDLTGNTVAQSKALYDAFVESRASNLLALNHETSNTTAHQVLPYAVSTLQRAGYKLVSLATCLGMHPYASVGTPGKLDCISAGYLDLLKDRGEVLL